MHRSPNEIQRENLSTQFFRSNESTRIQHTVDTHIQLHIRQYMQIQYMQILPTNQDPLLFYLLST